MNYSIVKLFPAAAIAMLLGAGFVSAQEVPSRNTPATPAPAVAAPPASQPAKAWSPGEAPQNLSVQLNKSVAVNIPGNINEVHFGKPGVAELIRLPRRNNKTGANAYIIGRSIDSTFMFVTDRGGNVIFEADVDVGVDVGGINAAISEMLPDEGIEAVAQRNRVLLRGYVRSPASSAQAVKIASGFVADPASITNSLEVLGSQQVIMQVKIAEIKRTAIKQLGVDFGLNSIGPAGGVQFNTVGRNFLSANASFATGIAATGIGALSPITFDVLENQNMGKTLAEPTLMAHSGEAASFLAGGSIPVQVLDANGNVSTAFQEYGIGLDFTPTVLDKGRINLAVTTTVSDIDWTNAVNGVPGLTEKTTSTTVDLPSGGTLFIAGLIQNDTTNGVDGVPGMKDLPVLGALFRSETFNNEETELVVIMTAYLAKPSSNADRLALPTDGFAPASDVDFYLLGRLHKTYTHKELPPYATPLAGSYGYIME